MTISPAYRAAPVFPELGDAFYSPVEAAGFPDHIPRYFNQQAAQSVGLGEMDEPEKIYHFGKFNPLPKNLDTPLALAYHGHQFGQYNPDIGDGRGFLFAQVRNDQNRILDLGTKGSGTTPWSRSGDGCLTLKGAVREMLASEMLDALGVYTSRTFCVIETGQSLWRNDEPSPTRSAVLTRLSHSHIRFGSFQRLAFLDQKDQMATLLDHVIRHYFPNLLALPEAERPAGFLQQVSKSHAKLCAGWMAAGFVHGVLNTDNMNINGQSFDYGPWRFLPTYQPEFTAAYFDHQGLFAYGRQPEAVTWNLARLGEALSLLAPVETLQNAHSAFARHWPDALANAFLRRLGLIPTDTKNDTRFIQVLIKALHQSQVPFEGFFFDWFCGDEARALTRPNLALYQASVFNEFRKDLQSYQPAKPERLAHPYFARERPETLLVEDVEKIWEPIAKQDNWQPFEDKMQTIQQIKMAYEG